MCLCEVPVGPVWHPAMTRPGPSGTRSHLGGQGHCLVTKERIVHTKECIVHSTEWVNLSKRGGMDGVFRGLAGLLGIPEEQPCQPEENPVLPDSFTQIYILFLIGFHIGPPKIHRQFPKSTGSVLALLSLPSIFSCQNFTVGEFWCTMAIMQEKQQYFLFEIE